MTSSSSRIELLSSESVNLLSKREEIRRLEVRCHLDTSGYDIVSLNHQIGDLVTDFPALYDDKIFSQHTIIVAMARNDEGEETVAGFVGLTSDEDDSSIVWLVFITVHPDYRRQGIAAKLLDSAISTFIEKRTFTKMRLLTLRGLMYPGCRLYQSRGFRIYQQRNGASQSLGLFHLLFYEKELISQSNTVDKPGKNMICDVQGVYPDNIEDICHCSCCARIREFCGSAANFGNQVINWDGREQLIEKGVMHGV